MRNGSIEGMELKVPILIENRGFRPDSGGPGKYRGGVGLLVRSRSLIDGRWNCSNPTAATARLGAFGAA